MAKPKKHSQKLINQAHEMAFEGKLTNAQIAKKLKLTKNQLAYIIYQCETKVYAKKAKPVAPKSFHVDKAKPKPKVEPQEEKTMLAKAFDWLLGT
jgi:orotate phosphoribosyltransferase-like protein